MSNNKIRSGSARILWDYEIEELQSDKIIISQECATGWCLICSLCRKWQTNGNDVWERFEKHWLRKHPEFLEKYLSDSRDIRYIDADLEFVEGILKVQRLMQEANK